MTYGGPSAASALRGRVPTGYGRLDEALQGGFLAGSAILLSAPASSEVPVLARNFLKASEEVALLICRSQSSAEAVSQPDDSNLKCVICSEKPIPPSKNMLQGKGIDNLTELNFQITETTGSIQPRRIVIEILSDILLRHKALQTRKWLSEFLEKLRSKGITTLTLLNPYMHASEEVQAVVDLFDGNLEIIEKDVEGQLQKFLRIKWMRGSEVAEKELPLADLVPETQARMPQITRPTHFKEPRWLTPLVGRTADLSKLKAAFNDALNNKSSIVTIHGEAGVGKTRLMQELAVSVHEKEVVVLAGRAAEEKIAYGPWVELLREYVGQTPGEMLRRMLGGNASEVARLVPDIAAKIGTVPPSKPLAEEQDRIRLYEAITQFLISICNEKPLVLLLDDMHWADQASLGLLQHFVMGSSNLRVLTLVGYRTEDVSTDSPLSKTSMKLNRERILESVSVKNLNNQETTELIKQTFGEATVSPEFADLIYNRTGGNPFFVEEVLRSLVEDGTIFRTEKGWDRKPIQEIILPESVKSLLKSRLTKLGSETLNLLTIASIIGSEFDLTILREVTQTQEDALLDHLKIAVDSDLIQEVPGKDAFRFTDNRIRELLLGDVLQSRRRRHQIKIAEAIEKIHSKNIEAHAEAIATHFSEGGDTERTIKYSLMAGDRNRTIHAYDQAIADYKRVLDLIEAERGRDAEKGVVLEKLAESYRVAGPVQEADRCFKEALTIFEKLNDIKACARACLGLSRVAGVRYRDRILVLKKGLEYLDTEPESFEAASIYAHLALYHGVIDEWDEANAFAGKALSVGEKTQNYEAIAISLAMKASFLTDTGRVDEGLPLWELAMNVALQNEQYEEALDAMANLSLYNYPRNLAKGRELTVRQSELCGRLNHITAEANALGWLWWLDWCAGDWKTALEDFTKGSQIAKRLGLFEAQFWAFDYGWFLLGIGDLEQAEAEFLKTTDEMKENPKLSVRVLYHLGLGLLREAQGRELEAKEHYEIGVDAFRKWEFTSYPMLHIETLLCLTRIYAKHGELEKARNMSQWAKRLAETLKSDAGLAMAYQAEAALLLANGDRKRAEETHLKSLGSWEKAGWQYHHGKALVAYSDAIAENNPEESRKRLMQAVEIFRKLGAKRDLEKAETKLLAKA